MFNNIFNRKYFSFVMFVILLQLNMCDYFNDENYVMQIEDKIAMESMEDPVASDEVMNTSKSSINQIVKSYQAQFSIDTVLTSSTLIDTLYQFNFTKSFTIRDTVTYRITSDTTQICYIDTVYNYEDSLTSETSMINYTNTITFTQNFNFDVILTTYSSGIKDTILTDDTELGISDIYSSMKHAGIDFTQTLNTYQVVTASSPDTSYLLFSSRKAATTYFYFSDYIKMEVYVENDENIEEVECQSDDIPLETTAGYYEYDETDEVVDPVIKSRYEYNLQSDLYLIKIITTDQTLSKSFRSVIIYEF